MNLGEFENYIYTPECYEIHSPDDDVPTTSSKKPYGVSKKRESRLTTQSSELSDQHDKRETRSMTRKRMVNFDEPQSKTSSMVRTANYFLIACVSQ